MANNNIGFAYMNHDTDRYQDIKIKRLKKEFKFGVGVTVYDYITNEIFRVKGCYLEWDDSVCFDVADYWEIEENMVKEIVDFCLKIGLFNRIKFDDFGVITGKSIQTRFLKWSKLAKRKDAKIPEEYNIIPEESPKFPEKTAEIQEVSNEEKRREEKRSKEKGREKKEGVFAPPVFDDIFVFFKSKIPETSWTDTKCKNEAKNFIDYYAKTDWQTRNGPITNWENAASGWIANDQKFDQKKTGKKHPDHWSKVWEQSLSFPEQKEYWGHLRNLGFAPKKDGNQNVIGWHKP